MTISANEQVEYIDATPTWEGVLPLLLAAYVEDTAEGRRSAEQELRRMARLADAQVAARKALK